MSEQQEPVADGARPFGPWESFEACIAEMQADGHDEEGAALICGALQKKLEAEPEPAPAANPEDVQPRAAHHGALHLRALAETPDAEQPDAPLRFVASTANIVRDGGVIEVDAWDTTNYERNPVFLWSHEYERLPIGRAAVKVEDGQLVADVIFDRADPFAAEVERKYRAGFLNAVSVGWDTLEEKAPEGAEKWRVAKADLLDLSAVAVPSDPAALAARQAHTVDEAVFANAAAAMVAVCSPAAEDSDDLRQRRYNALLPAYRRAGQTPPEFLDGATLRALDAPTWRGLFLAGEVAIVAAGSRVGAVLAARNRTDLEQIITLAQAILRRADHEPEPAPEPERAVDPALVRLHQLLNEVKL